ncbi:hypothetical protein BBBOND_0300450 [Babesia bigemina]|uniref:6-Cys domain-containing protein n=1 Tax=Babesia bigemina TaxID=5866 RepID=A0A061DDB9_BABBI|nr:hypothetical protein BBBOND_0300450 [Babesia bigemina]CDR96140.1 hypothetical protein BBBOND_0300450 [Babesia bigemina]|eukprot:XP_012768326.1 hypothetical protein BBBOND_0300450 [Babesia bigemina]
MPLTGEIFKIGHVLSEFYQNRWPPYVLEPPNCFDQVYVEDEVKNLSDISQSLVASHSNHFVTVRLYSSLAGPYETLRQTPPLECRCVTIKGIVLSTIQIENYYSK